MVSLLVVYQGALHAATVMLISEAIVRVLTMEVNGPTVVYGMNNLLVVCQEALHATTPVSEITAQAPTTKRSMQTAVTMVKSVVRGKTKFRRLMSSVSKDGPVNTSSRCPFFIQKFTKVAPNILTKETNRESLVL